MILAYYVTDFLRQIFIIFYLIFKINFFDLLYIVMVPNELLLLVLIIGVPIVRYSFPGRLCSGDYTIFFFDAHYQSVGQWFMIMTWILPLYSFVF